MSLRNQAASGFVWTFTQQFGNQFISFVISLILARILLPEEFGLIGMIAIFVSIGKGLIDSGLTHSLIRKKEPDQLDFSTVFYFNLVASLIIYLIVYFLAPFIAQFYDQQLLVNIIRLYCLTFIIDAFKTVQRTHLTKLLNFKTQAIIALPSTIFGGIVGIILAYSGYGVWSLVWSNISSSLVSSLQFWFYSKWRPSLKFNFDRFKEHFNFGYKLTLSSLLNSFFNNIYLIIIGKFFAISQVGFYTRAETMKQLPVKNIGRALNKVTYPLFASIQKEDERLKKVYSLLMKIVVFLIAPILIFLAVIAEPLFVFLFTEKWLPAVPYFQILCVTGILYPINSYNLNILKVKGRSDLFLKLEVIKKIIIVAMIIIAINFGIYGLLFGQVIISFISFFINSYYMGKFLNYTAYDQVKDIIPILLIGIFAGAAVFLWDSMVAWDFLNILRILSGGILGIIIYSSLSYLFQRKLLFNIIKLIKNR